MEQLIPFILGVVASVIAGVLLSYSQFSASIAGYRVRMAVDATRTIRNGLEKEQAGSFRNRYRYSLGVIIDELNRIYGDDVESAPQDRWPLMINPPEKIPTQNNDDWGDRWKRFNDYVRPVIVDINVYTYIAYILEFAPPIFEWNLSRQLAKLTLLCQKLETVVSLLDAALEDSYVRPYIQVGRYEITVTRDSGVELTTQACRHIDELNTAHSELFAAWKEWVNATKQVKRYSD